MFGVNPSCAWGAWPCPRRRRCRARVWNSGYGWGRGSGRLPPCCSSPSPATSGRRTKGAVFFFFSDLNSFSSVLCAFGPCPSLTFSFPQSCSCLVFSMSLYTSISCSSYNSTSFISIFCAILRVNLVGFFCAISIFIFPSLCLFVISSLVLSSARFLFLLSFKIKAKFPSCCSLSPSCEAAVTEHHRGSPSSEPL